MKMKTFNMYTTKTLYYIKYTLAQNNIYFKTRVNPIRSSLHWWIISIDDCSITIQLEEPILTVELLTEVLTFITDNFTNVEDVYLNLLGNENLAGCNPNSNEKELEPIIKRFKREYNKHVTYVW